MSGASSRTAPLPHLARALWSWLRAVSGDDAYECYRAHHGARHAREPLMTRREFFEDAQRRKWSGISRCC